MYHLASFLVFSRYPETLLLEFLVTLEYQDSRTAISSTLMPLYHCHKPVFRPKMAILWRAGMREREGATPTSISIFDFYEIKTL